MPWVFENMLNMVLVIDKPGLAQTPNNCTTLGFRSGKPFLPTLWSVAELSVNVGMNFKDDLASKINKML